MDSFSNGITLEGGQKKLLVDLAGEPVSGRVDRKRNGEQIWDLIWEQQQVPVASQWEETVPVMEDPELLGTFRSDLELFWGSYADVVGATTDATDVGGGGVT